MIRTVEYKDVADVCRIYNHYVVHTTASFEVDEVNEKEMAHRVSVVLRHFPWLVIEDDGVILGFAYASYWKARTSYTYTLESTIYLSHEQCGKGLGKKLYTALLNRLRNGHDVHRLLACVSLPNDASVQLHEELGYKKVAHFNQAGRKFNQWIDVGYWQLEI